MMREGHHRAGQESALRPNPDVWRSTVRLLLECPGVDARDLDALHRVTGWRKLGRIEQVWLATLAAQHLDGAADDPGEDDHDAD